MQDNFSIYFRVDRLSRCKGLDGPTLRLEECGQGIAFSAPGFGVALETEGKQQVNLQPSDF